MSADEIAGTLNAPLVIRSCPNHTFWVCFVTNDPRDDDQLYKISHCLKARVSSQDTMLVAHAGKPGARAERY